ncbi:MAG: type II toxin-antitoxin system RelE/ParE family toxin [Chromatiaceae bacterium]
MATVTLTHQARRDLIAIWNYIADDNPIAADHLLDSLDERINQLADHPFLVPLRRDIAPDLRYLVVHNYLLLYRATLDAVEVVRVLHGARNLKTLFSDDEQ